MLRRVSGDLRVCAANFSSDNLLASSRAALIFPATAVILAAMRPASSSEAAVLEASAAEELLARASAVMAWEGLGPGLAGSTLAGLPFVGLLTASSLYWLRCSRLLRLASDPVTHDTRPIGSPGVAARNPTRLGRWMLCRPPMSRAPCRIASNCAEVSGLHRRIGI
ncbi:hypothetical protein V8C86DRAFT_2491871 [Haematococcus lacustris]